MEQITLKGWTYTVIKRVLGVVYYQATYNTYTGGIQTVLDETWDQWTAESLFERKRTTGTNGNKNDASEGKSQGNGQATPHLSPRESHGQDPQTTRAANRALAFDGTETVD